MAIRVIEGDCQDMLKTLSSESVHTVVTSPPYYGLRDYGIVGQLGLEATPAEYIANMVAVFREVRRVLRRDGTCWVNIGDSYAGSGPSGASYQSATTQRRESMASDGNFRLSKTLGERGLTYADKKPIPPPGLKPKDLIGIPWMLAFALRDDGWYLRADIIWSKPNPMPESVTDRPTKAHEYVFLLTRSARYFYDADAIRETDNGKASGNGFVRDHRLTYQNPDGTARGNPDEWLPGGGRNKRSVWEIATEAFPEAHFATYPTALVEPCIKAGCPPGGTVLDPFCGSGTTLLVADRLERDAVGIELNPTYAAMARRRVSNDAPMFVQLNA